MLKNKYLTIGTILLGLLLFMTFLGPMLPFVDNELKIERMKFSEDGGMRRAPIEPSEGFPLGTDREGRDILSMLIVGAKETLFLIFMITALRYVLAIALALLASKGTGIFYKILSVWNQVFSSLPTIFSAIIIVSIPYFVFNENRLAWFIVLVALIEVGKAGMIIQQQANSISKSAYVEAGITVGVGPMGLYSRYYLPNLLPEIFVNFCIDLGRTALLIGQLGIFGIFVSQQFLQTNYGSGEVLNTSINWATMIGAARNDIFLNFWIPFFPALALTIVIMIFNILGEGLRQHFGSKGSASQF